MFICESIGRGAEPPSPRRLGGRRAKPKSITLDARIRIVAQTGQKTERQPVTCRYNAAPVPCRDGVCGVALCRCSRFPTLANGGGQTTRAIRDSDRLLRLFQNATPNIDAQSRIAVLGIGHDSVGHAMLVLHEGKMVVSTLVRRPDPSRRSNLVSVRQESAACRTNIGSHLIQT